MVQLSCQFRTKQGPYIHIALKCFSPEHVFNLPLDNFFVQAIRHCYSHHQRYNKSKPLNDTQTIDFIHFNTKVYNIEVKTENCKNKLAHLEWKLKSQYLTLRTNIKKYQNYNNIFFFGRVSISS